MWFQELTFLIGSVKLIGAKLKEAVLNEDYETAAKIRDEISKKS